MPIDKISGVAFTAINKLSGIAKASIANVSGVSTAAASNVEFFVDASDSSSYSGSGTTWSDLSGNGYDLTLTNAALTMVYFGEVQALRVL